MSKWVNSNSELVPAGLVYLPVPYQPEVTEQNYLYLTYRTEPILSTRYLPFLPNKSRIYKPVKLRNRRSESAPVNLLQQLHCSKSVAETSHQKQGQC